MEQRHRTLLNYQMQNLVKCTNNVESIVKKLMEKNVINNWMKNHILSSTPDESSKIERLYEVIQGRGPNAISNLCDALYETGNKEAHLLVVSLKNIPISPEDLVRYMKNCIIKNEMNLNNEEPYVKIHPDLRRMDIDNENLPNGAYHMGSNPKGHAFILNINKASGYSDRKGSDVDVTNLQKLFKGFGYNVQSKEDLTENAFKEELDEFINLCQNEKADSIVVFLMSHGHAGNSLSRSLDIVTSDGIKINTDWIIEQFGLHNISRSIPKLFFIQACRGNNIDVGWTPVDSENNLLQNNNINVYINNTIQNDSTFTDSSPVGQIMNRRYENVFIAYATVPGYFAKRDSVDGSWFVQKLCEVFRENAWQHELTTMMEMVDQEIKKLNCTMFGYQTTEWTYRGFNKKFYFNPGIYDNNSDHDHSMTTEAVSTNNVK